MVYLLSMCLNVSVAMCVYLQFSMWMIYIQKAANVLLINGHKKETAMP